MEKNTEIGDLMLIVGSYAEKTEPGIYLCRFDSSRCSIQILQHMDGNENPSYLFAPKNSNLIYAVSENKKNDDGSLSVYSLSANTLQKVGGVSYLGAGSCYISVGRNIRHAFIANYLSGSLSVLPLDNGLPTAAVQTLKFEGKGVDAERQDSPHIHSAVLSADETTLYCTDLGTDQVYVFRYDADAEIPLIAENPPYITLPFGNGPRHIACSENGNWLYVLCELTGALFAFLQRGSLAPSFQELSVNDKGFNGKIEAADLQIHPSGHYLYASNRGDANQIIVFKIDQHNGHLAKIQSVYAQGKSPRNLLISPDGRFLLVANENSDSITTFEISPSTGKLTFTGKSVVLKKPTCLKFLVHECETTSIALTAIAELN